MSRFHHLKERNMNLEHYEYLLQGSSSKTVYSKNDMSFLSWIAGHIASTDSFALTDFLFSAHLPLHLRQIVLVCYTPYPQATA